MLKTIEKNLDNSIYFYKYTLFKRIFRITISFDHRILETLLNISENKI